MDEVGYTVTVTLWIVLALWFVLAPLVALAVGRVVALRDAAERPRFGGLRVVPRDRAA